MDDKNREQSEIGIRDIAKDFFLGEFVFEDLVYTPKEKKSNIELADCLISYSNIIIGFQIKERKAGSSGNEDKWAMEKIKDAKHQIVSTLQQLKDYQIPHFKNLNGEDVALPREGIFLGIVILKNNNIKTYSQIATTKNYDGNINCFEYEDFKKCCNKLLLPKEILEYMQFRGVTIESNGGAFIKEDVILDQYLMKKYSATQLKEDFVDAYRWMLTEYKNHMIDKSKNVEKREILSILLNMDRHEVDVYCDLLIKARKYAERGIRQNSLMMIPISTNGVSHIFISAMEYDQSYIERVMILFMYKTKSNKCMSTIIFLEDDENYVMYHFYREQEWEYDQKLEEICQDPSLKNKWNPKKISTKEYICS